jgi:catalase
VADEFAEQVVAAMADISGVHPGYRAAHAKGTLCSGSFTATPEAARLTRAAHLQGDPVRATVRFSNGSGDPHAPGHSTDGRGLAVKLYLEDGTKTDMVAVTLPVFFVRTPEDFLDFVRVRKPDPETGEPDMEKVGAWLGEHQEAVPAIQAALGAEPPASYANCAYNGIHAFRYLDADDGETYVRFRWEPEDGEATISRDEAKERGSDYLLDEILERIKQGPSAFRLVLQLAEEGDPVDDPTAAWPEERKTVVAGRLEVTGPETEREQGDDVLVFDPTRVTDGIELSDDQILRFRPRAYSVSVERRSGIPAPTAPAS